MEDTDGRRARTDLNKIRVRRGLQGKTTTITATPKPDMVPVISQEITVPGQAPIPPEPVPDCKSWRYFVERWEVSDIQSKAHSIPTIVGYDTITFNFGGVITSYEMPRIVNVPVTTVIITYEWVADEYNGCGSKLSTHRSGIKQSSSSMLSNTQLANAIIANSAQAMQLEMWNRALLDRANAAGQQAVSSSVHPNSLVVGAYNDVQSGIAATQRKIEQAMRDYAYKVKLYNTELEQHQKHVQMYEDYKQKVADYDKAVAEYNEQVEIISNMIREDKVGSAYTVKGAGNRTVSLTVGQEITGSELISSGIQSTGSGFNIDPNATYIITDVEITNSAPRVNVPGLTGISYPGRITITK